MSDIIFSKSHYWYQRERPDMVRDYETLHQEFTMNVEYPERIDDWWIAVDSRNFSIYSINVQNPDVFYKKTIDIDKASGMDYWFIQKIFKIDGVIRIIQSDYGGIQLMDERLNTIFHVPRTQEMIEKNAVYGFYITTSQIIYWVIDDFVMSEHEMKEAADNQKLREPFMHLGKSERALIRFMSKQGIYEEHTIVYHNPKYIPDNDRMFYTF